MLRRAIVAVLAPIALSACAPWHIFSHGSPCKQAINYGRRRITVGSTTVPIGSSGVGETIQIGQVDVDPDLARGASDVVQQFDQLQLSTCQTMQSLKSSDRAPFNQLRVQVLTDFAFVVTTLHSAKTRGDYAGAVTDARARLGNDSRAVARLNQP